MTILDQIGAKSRSIVQTLVDKEPVNYLEAGALYGIVLHGRYHVALLSVLHNHAQDPELKKLIKEAIDELAEPTAKQCEDLLRAGRAEVPAFEFPKHPLENRLDIPGPAHLTDMEIAMSLESLNASGQIAVLTAIHQCYQLDIGIALRDKLIRGLDWSYRLMRLTLQRGWLPQIAKVEH